MMTEDAMPNTIMNPFEIVPLFVKILWSRADDITTTLINVSNYSEWKTKQWQRHFKAFNRIGKLFLTLQFVCVIVSWATYINDLSTCFAKILAVQCQGFLYIIHQSITHNGKYSPSVQRIFSYKCNLLYTLYVVQI